MPNAVFLTRKIQILIDAPDKEQRANYLQELYHWQTNCHFAANYICSHLYLNEQIKDFIYLSEGIKVKLEDVKKQGGGIFNTSKLNAT